jgi:hypothetical protein
VAHNLVQYEMLMDEDGEFTGKEVLVYENIDRGELTTRTVFRTSAWYVPPAKRREDSPDASPPGDGPGRRGRRRR